LDLVPKAFEMVLDSSALIAIFKREPGFEALERKIDLADAILIGAPTLLETAMVLTGQTRRDHRAILAAYLRRIDAEVFEFSENHYFAVVGDRLLYVGADFAHTDISAA